MALSLKENLQEKVVLIGKETTKKSVGQNVNTDNHNHILFAVVNFNWFVNDKTVDDLNNYLNEYENIKLEEDDDYCFCQQESVPPC